MSDWMDDPRARAWAERVRDEVAPMIEQSNVFLTIAPEEADVKFAVELGFAIMLNKPIIVVVPAGRVVPPKLAALAEKVVAYDGTVTGLRAAVEEVLDD